MKFENKVMFYLQLFQVNFLLKTKTRTFKYIKYFRGGLTSSLVNDTLRKIYENDSLKATYILTINFIKKL